MNLDDLLWFSHAGVVIPLAIRFQWIGNTSESELDETCWFDCPIKFIIETPFAIDIYHLNNEESMKILQSTEITSSSSSSSSSQGCCCYVRIGWVMKAIISNSHPFLHIHSMKVIHQMQQQRAVSTTPNDDYHSCRNNNDINLSNQSSSLLWQQWIQQPTKEEDIGNEWMVELRLNEEYLKTTNPIALQIQYSL